MPFYFPLCERSTARKAERRRKSLFLQLGQDSVSSRDVDATLSLLGGVNHLAMVDGDGIPSSSVAHGPANSLAERKLGIRSEDLLCFFVRLANVVPQTPQRRRVYGRGGGVNEEGRK